MFSGAPIMFVTTSSVSANASGPSVSMMMSSYASVPNGLMKAIRLPIGWLPSPCGFPRYGDGCVAPRLFAGRRVDDRSPCIEVAGSMSRRRRRGANDVAIDGRLIHFPMLGLRSKHLLSSHVEQGLRTRAPQPVPEVADLPCQERVWAGRVQVGVERPVG